MSMNENPLAKNRKNLILHIDVEFTLGTLGLILWLNIDGLGGIIAGSTVLAIMLAYIFLAFSPNSKFDLWIDEILHRINLKSLTRKPKSGLYGILMLLIGFTDIIAYYFLSYVIEFPRLACLCMMVGAIVKFLSLFAIFRTTQNPRGQIIMMYVIMFAIWVIGSQLLYFTILLFTYITPTI